MYCDGTSNYNMNLDLSKDISSLCRWKTNFNIFAITFDCSTFVIKLDFYYLHHLLTQGCYLHRSKDLCYN